MGFVNQFMTRGLHIVASQLNSRLGFINPGLTLPAGKLTTINNLTLKITIIFCSGN